MNFDRGFRWVRLYWPLLLPVFFYLPALGGYPYPAGEGAFSDLAVTHQPYLVYFKRALFEFGQWPLWNAQILSGAPFAANPLSGIWYPPGWIALFFPDPFGINLVVSFHVFWGVLGFYLFSRHLRIGRQGSLFGAAAFGAMPKLLAHFGAGHISLLYSVPWTPWLLLAEGTIQGARGLRRLFRPGLILGVIFLADVRWAVYAGLLWVSWKVYLDVLDLPGEPDGTLRSSLIRIARSLLAAGQQMALAASLAAPLALPLLEYIRLSARSGLQAADSLVFSLPPIRLIGLVIPDFGGLQEWVLYQGVAVLLLAFLGLLNRKEFHHARFWFFVFVLSLLISLGEYLPGNRWLVMLPGFNLLRVPPRAAFVGLFALVILAASGVQRIRHGLTARLRRRATLFVFGLGSFVGALSVGLLILASSLPEEFPWWLGILVLTSLWIVLGVHGRTPRPLWFPVLLVLSFIDWGLIHQANLQIRNTAEVHAQGAAAAAYIAGDKGHFRTYSPSYSLPQHTAARFHLELADGVDPLYLEAYSGFMDLATGIPRAGYSVTIPPYAGGHPDQDNLSFLPDEERLGWLNVKYVAAEFELDSPDLLFINQIAETRIYQNTRYRPRAWMQEIPSQIKDPGADAEPLAASISPVLAQEATIRSWTPNKIHLTAQGPGLLVLSEMAYPGWQVRVDGELAAPVLVAGLFRGVVLRSPGLHQVTFAFRPLTVFLGLGVQLITIFGLFWFGYRPEGRTAQIRV